MIPDYSAKRAVGLAESMMLKMRKPLFGLAVTDGSKSIFFWVFRTRANGEGQMQAMNWRIIMFVLALVQMGCESSSQNRFEQDVNANDDLTQQIYLNIMNRYADYENLPANKKTLAVCINWEGTRESYVDVRYSYAYYESQFSERAIRSSELMAGAVGGCENVKRQKSLDCQCVAVDRNGSSVIEVPDSVRRNSNVTQPIPAAESEDSEVAVRAGEVTSSYEDGLRAYRMSNFAGARAIWLPLAENGHAVSQYSLGKLYEVGGGDVLRDFTAAALWYTRAADQGVPAAQNNLGLLYFRGQGVPKNMTRAAELYCASAEADHSIAQYTLGLSYYRGQGVEEDRQLAIYWLRRAGVNGSVDALYALGQYFRLFEEGEESKVEALYWYQRAASEGHAGAQTQAKSLLDAGVKARKNRSPNDRLQGGLNCS